MTRRQLRGPRAGVASFPLARRGEKAAVVASGSVSAQPSFTEVNALRPGTETKKVREPLWLGLPLSRPSLPAPLGLWEPEGQGARLEGSEVAFVGCGQGNGAEAGAGALLVAPSLLLHRPSLLKSRGSFVASEREVCWKVIWGLRV